MTVSRNSRWPARKARILIVDDHAIVREGVSLLANQEPDLDICRQAASAAEAMDALRHEEFDLVITDLTFSGVSGIELIRSIRARWADLPILVMSMHDEMVYAERVLRAGAQGYVMKLEATEKVLVAARKVLQGEIYLSEQLQAKVLRRLVGKQEDQEVSTVDRLTNRELEVLRLIGMGYGTSEIAAKLTRGVKTIETYRQRLKQKLGLTTSAQLAKFAVQWLEQESWRGSEPDGAPPTDSNPPK